MIFLNLFHILDKVDAVNILIHEHCHSKFTKHNVFPNYHFRGKRFTKPIFRKFLEEWVEAEQNVDLLSGWIAAEKFNIEYDFNYLNDRHPFVSQVIEEVAIILSDPQEFEAKYSEFKLHIKNNT